MDQFIGNDPYYDGSSEVLESYGTYAVSAEILLLPKSSTMKQATSLSFLIFLVIVWK